MVSNSVSANSSANAALKKELQWKSLVALISLVATVLLLTGEATLITGLALWANLGLLVWLGYSAIGSIYAKLEIEKLKS